MDDVAIARALHVLAVVVWIGGVAMVTMVVLPAVRDGDVGPNRLVVFEAIERRFAWPARAATVIVGLTGFYMTQRLELWERFWSSEFWWMHAMVCIGRSTRSVYFWLNLYSSTGVCASVQTSDWKRCSLNWRRCIGYRSR